MAIKALKAGAFEFIEKPFNQERLLNFVNRAVENINLKNKNKEFESKLFYSYELIGVSDNIKNIKEQLLTELNSGKVIKLEKRLAMLSAKLAIVKVGGDSDVELNEKKDRVEDAICATKAAIKEGVVAGGGVALVNASESIKAKTPAEEVVLKALYHPCKTIMKNAGLEYKNIDKKDWGVNVETGKTVNMFKAGIIDPVLVTKSALKNAASSKP